MTVFIVYVEPRSPKISVSQVLVDCAPVLKCLDTPQACSFVPNCPHIIGIRDLHSLAAVAVCSFLLSRDPKRTGSYVNHGWLRCVVAYSVRSHDITDAQQQNNSQTSGIVERPRSACALSFAFHNSDGLSNKLFYDLTKLYDAARLRDLSVGK